MQAQLVRQAYDSASTSSSTTYAAVLGSAFEFRRLVRGNVYAGYRQRNYDVTAVGSYGAFTYGVDAAWFPTELMTVKVSGKQDFSDAAGQGAGGISVVNTRTVQGQVDYEVLRQMILSGTVAYASNSYQSPLEWTK